MCNYFKLSQNVDTCAFLLRATRTKLSVQSQIKVQYFVFVRLKVNDFFLHTVCKKIHENTRVHLFRFQLHKINSRFYLVASCHSRSMMVLFSKMAFFRSFSNLVISLYGL